MGYTVTVREAVSILGSSERAKPGVTNREIGPVQWTHYDKPVWWETDYFGAVDAEPAEVIRIVRECQPGPHLIGVVTTDPDGILAAYAELGYQTVPSERLETIMARNLLGCGRVKERYPVQLVQTEQQRCLYNTMISADDGHGQMQPDELGDPSLRHYFIEMDGLSVCYAKVIQSTPIALVVEPLGTREGYRRRGIATALMNRLHADAAEGGAELCVINASSMGVLLYTTLGYEIVAYIQKFVPRGFNPADFR
jgi:ribosomal protein S18 acetylase RimI-like enzyme